MMELRCTYFSPYTTDEERVILADEYHKFYVMLPLQEAQGIGPIHGDVLPFRPDPTIEEIKANLGPEICAGIEEQRKIKIKALQQAGEA